MSDDMIPAIRAAAADTEAVGRRLRELVAKAASSHDANVAAIAEAAGVTRQTVYRWRAEIMPGHTRPYRDPARAMDEALYALLDAGSGPAHELTSGLRTHKRDAKARRVLLGAGNLNPGRADEEQTAIIQVGCVAANDILHPGDGRGIR